MVSMTVALLFSHISRKGLDGGALPVYWSLKVLTLGHMLILAIATQYPSQEDIEPLAAGFCSACSRSPGLSSWAKPPAASLAVSLGGALFAYWSLWKMVRGLRT